MHTILGIAQDHNYLSSQMINTFNNKNAQDQWSSDPIIEPN